MRRKRFLGFLPAFCLVALPLVVHSASTMKLGSTSGEYNTAVSVNLTLTTEDQVQGFVSAIGIDGCATAVDLIPASPLLDTTVEAGADTVVVRVESDYVVIGVVMDSNPNDNETLPEVIEPGEDILLATLRLQCCADPGDGSSPVTALAFVDGMYATTEGGPALDNIVVVGGLSFGDGQGLTLEDGSVTCTPTPDSIKIEDTTADPILGANVRVLMTNVSGPVEGFVVAACYDPEEVAADAAGVVLGQDENAQKADFIATEMGDTGVAIGVVIDLIDPMEFPPNIEPGADHHILTIPFDCVAANCPSSPADPAITADVSLCDGVIGDPLKENLIVVGGLSIGVSDGLVLQGGTITWLRDCIPSREICNGLDDDCNGLIDDIDGVEGAVCLAYDFEVGVLTQDHRAVDPICLTGFVGGTASGMLWLNSPDVTGAAPNTPPDGIRDSVQGFSIGLVYPCDKIQPVEDLDFTGTTLDAEGAEFVGVSAGPGVTDTGDEVCSMVIGVLLDAVAPFDGQVIAPMPVPQAMGKLSFVLLEGFACDETVTLAQQDGVRGRGNTPVFNLVSVENYAYEASVRPITICRSGGNIDGGIFFRGDCNYSLRNGGLTDPVEISDAAAVVSYLFGAPPYDFQPPCLDACDANDDARINIADALAILYFLFVPENTFFLPEPYPGYEPPPTWPTVVRIGPGTDPTADSIDCKAGEECVD